MGVTPTLLELPVGGGAEVLDAGVEFAGGEGFHAAGGECLAGEGGEHGAVDNSLAQNRSVIRRVALGREIAGHAAEEGVAGTGGIGNGFERVGGTAEDVEVRSGDVGVRSSEFGVRSGEFGVRSGRFLDSALRTLRSALLRKEHGSELAEFDDDVAGAFFEEGTAGFDEIGGAGEVAGFAFVEDEEIEMREDLVETVVGDLDPEVHGVGDDEARGVRSDCGVGSAECGVGSSECVGKAIPRSAFPTPHLASCSAISKATVFLPSVM